MELCCRECARAAASLRGLLCASAAPPSGGLRQHKKAWALSLRVGSA